ncbi:reprolysin-like metallopeptidase [uncultured Winogradskyella sp.]|uniref:zinc-dependent metalloprotease n=1 Tax=uncultured Winogradskyella sp. TaxID=395353 RepID=UPI00260BB5CE|nr:zinc-dependent metalloprotease family protein [uncultured Winogradskyella sp.]
MNQNYFKIMAVTAICFCSLFTHAQNSNELWISVSEAKAQKAEQISRKIILATEKFYQLDVKQLKNSLINVGNRKNTGNTVISFPNSDGKLNRYKVFEASVMAPELESQFPNMKSYAGQGIDNPSETIRFSITPKGLNVMLLGTSKGTQFIDPFTTEGNIYTVYAKKNLEARNFDFECGVIDEPELLNKTSDSINIAKNADDGTLRDYRIAIACTGEYATFHGGTVAGAMAAMVTTMTRVNGIYERELSMTMTMIANNADIIYLDGTTDPFNNDSASQLINQSQSVIDAEIGSANYDIGHTFSTGGGGLAALGSSCNNSNKARGITGSPQPAGDSFDVDFVAHELGHQFGSTHTFNGNVGSCSGGNRTASSAYEPGSGSTIMAYAGICGSDNVQNNSDDYFHQKSLDLIWTHITSSFVCPVNTTATGNNEPNANAGSDYTIPQGTPYKLDGGASTDPDGLASLTYTWEQYDLGPAGSPLETNTTGPLTRTYKGTNDPVRYVPRLPDVLSNGGVSTTWEKLATVDRAINYSLTVRDNDATGGQTDVDQMTATVTTDAGPFIVTSQNTGGISWDNGSTQTVTWNVAGTNANGVNATNVNILLSTDGGINFDTVLASSTPNDGSHSFTVPNNVAGTNCRIMVEGDNNIFFNVNSTEFQIGSVVCNEFPSGAVGLAIPDGPSPNQPGTVVFSTINVSDSGPISSMKISLNITHTYIGDLVVQLQHPNGTDFVNVWNRTCNSTAFGNIDVTLEDGLPAISCASPTTGSYAPENALSAFNGLEMNGDWTIALVDNYNGDIGTLNNWSVEFCVPAGLSIAENELDKLSIYPNPNNGEFNIVFNPTSGEAITIEVYDIRGRAIFTNVFSSVSRFDQVIKLNNAQSGVYLLTIADGSQKVTKKIIVD